MRHGKGIYTYVPATEYMGSFVDDKMHGYGILRTNISIFNGKLTYNEYIGNFVKGKRHGKGVFKDKNGGGFEGSWKQDKKMEEV